MIRRTFLKAASALPLGFVFGGISATAQESASDIYARRAAKWTAEALAAFPYELIQVRGSSALQEWEQLKAETRGTPIVIGDDKALDFIVRPFHPDYTKSGDAPNIAEILDKANRLTHPESLTAYRQAEIEESKRWCEANPQLCETGSVLAELLGGADSNAVLAGEPPIGHWPIRSPGPVALTVIQDWRTGQAFDSVYIVLVPTEDSTTIPAYLRWGGWNANPLPEYHVAALRSWRDRFSAELIGLSGDVMNIRVATRPQSRDEALALAREQYAYCNDIVDQGMGTLSYLAAALKAHNWWFFWWD